MSRPQIAQPVDQPDTQEFSTSVHILPHRQNDTNPHGCPTSDPQPTSCTVEQMADEHTRDTAPCPCSGDRCTLPTRDRRHGTSNGYLHHHCRCTDCRAGHAQRRRATGTTATDRAIRRAQTLAAGKVRELFPTLWQRCVDQAYDDLGIERRPVGTNTPRSTR